MYILITLHGQIEKQNLERHKACLHDMEQQSFLTVDPSLELFYLYLVHTSDGFQWSGEVYPSLNQKVIFGLSKVPLANNLQVNTETTVFFPLSLQLSVDNQHQNQYKLEMGDFVLHR